MRKKSIIVFIIIVSSILIYFWLAPIGVYKNGDVIEKDKLLIKLNDLNEQFILNPKWEIIESQQLEVNDYFIYLGLNDSDTFKVAQVFVRKGFDSLNIVYLNKIFYSFEGTHVISFKEDTLYYYILDSTTNTKEFIKGETIYRYRTGKMSSDELKVFIENDSLRKSR